MSRLFSRRRMIGVGGAVAFAPLALARPVEAANPTGPLVVLSTPERLYDSRVDRVPLNGAKLQTGSSLAVTAAGFGETGILVAAFINLTVTQTEGAGYLRVRGSDLSGEQPPPKTSNINWSAAGQTLANLAITPIGGENAIEVHAGGNGRTHVIVDIMGYIPFVG